MNQYYIKFKLRHILKMAGFEPESFKISSSPHPGKVVLTIELDYGDVEK